MAMIYDVFSFNGEFDVLELRLNVLDDKVDKFIICEANETFTGFPKPFYFFQQERRYRKFWKKIEHYTMSPYPADEELMLQASQSPGVPQNLHWWRREFCQKESIKRALAGLNDDDFVFVGDADEIWNPDNMPPLDTKWKLEQLVYSYYLNNRSSEPWKGTFGAPYKIIKTDTLDNLRAYDSHRSYMLPQVWPNGGWHFTNMGGVDFIKRKLNSYSHQEFNHEGVLNALEDQIKANKDFIGRDFSFGVDESGWPKYLKENKEKYAHLCL